MSAGKNIMLCAAQRTGSTLVMDDLRNVLGYGRVDSEFIYSLIFRQRSEETWEAIYPKIRDKMMVRDFVLNKVMFHYTPYVSGFIAGKRFERFPPVLTFEPARFDDFFAFFREAIWVSVERQDIFSQAVSLFAAEATKVWEVLQETPPEKRPGKPQVAYEKERLLRLLGNFLLERNGWRDFFEHYAIEPLMITYEDAVGGYPNYLAALLEAMGEEQRHPLPQRRMLKVGDAHHDSLAARLREDAMADRHLRGLIQTA